MSLYYGSRNNWKEIRSLFAIFVQKAVLVRVFGQMGFKVLALLLEVHWELIVDVVEERQDRGIFVFVGFVESLGYQLSSVASFLLFIWHLSALNAIQKFS